MISFKFKTMRKEILANKFDLSLINFSANTDYCRHAFRKIQAYIFNWEGMPLDEKGVILANIHQQKTSCQDSVSCVSSSWL